MQYTAENITPWSRWAILDWLWVVNMHFGLKNKIFFAAVDFMDRVLKKTRGFNHKKFQALGASCHMMASKLYEIDRCDIEEYVRICDNTYDEQQLRNMELMIYVTLDGVMTTDNLFDRIDIGLYPYCDKSVDYAILILFGAIYDKNVLEKFGPIKVSVAVNAVLEMLCDGSVMDEGELTRSVFHCVDAIARGIYSIKSIQDDEIAISGNIGFGPHVVAGTGINQDTVQEVVKGCTAVSELENTVDHYESPFPETDHGLPTCYND